MAVDRSYLELLRDPRWQRMRLEVMQRAEFVCERCGESNVTLNVHHTYYEKDCKPWEYPADSLACLCERCHSLFTKTMIKLKRALGLLPYEDLVFLLGVARTLHALNSDDPDAPVAIESYLEAIGASTAWHAFRHPTTMKEITDFAEKLIRFTKEGPCPK